MPLITPEYARLNAELHARRQDYGTGGHKHAAFVMALVTETRAKSVLDYGCGKGTLASALTGIRVFEYDPAIEGKDQLPSSAGVVVCCDVLEHVEPEFTEAVVAEICRLATRAVFVVVSCRQSSKRLADGRPAHINLRSAEFWHSLFREHGDFREIDGNPGEYTAVWRIK